MPTRETFHSMRAGPEATRACAQALAVGQLVVAATETVYGVFGRDRSSLAGLVGEDAAAGAAVHAVDVDGALRALGGLHPWQARMLRRVLPGALTVVSGDRAVRVPDHAGCRALLNAAADIGIDGVLGAALPIAQPRSLDGMTDADRSRLTDGGVTVAIDDGPARLGAPSTVIRMTDSAYEVVREGVIEARYLDKLVRRTVLFVCTGNTCRSPMAAAIARDLLADASGDDPLTEVVSAGLSAGPGSPMTPSAANALRAIGVEPGEHRSRSLSDRDLNRADHVFAMTAGHLAGLAGGAGGRAELLDPEGGDVPDPFGGSQDEYDACCRRIRELVTSRLQSLGMITQGDAAAGDMQ